MCASPRQETLAARDFPPADGGWRGQTGVVSTMQIPIDAMAQPIEYRRYDASP